MSHCVIRNAKVGVKQIIDQSKNPIAEITINDKYQHRFHKNSRVSKHLNLISPQQLEQTLTGGTYLIIDDQLADFRDKNYTHFVHDDSSIDKMIDIIGYTKDQNNSRRRTRQNRRDHDAFESSISLKNEWDKTEIIIPHYQQGGEFTSELSFQWSPFMKTINTTFDLVRQICTNGMVGMTTLLSTKVPVINRWEQHLDIAAKQTQLNIIDLVSKRLNQIDKFSASVGQCLALSQDINNRIQTTPLINSDQIQMLQNLAYVVSPITHLSKFYNQNVFNDKHIADQLPSHLTQLDMFNIATELRTHTIANDKSPQSRLDRFANYALFDSKKLQYEQANKSTNKLSYFSNREQAFFSEIN